IESAVSGGSGSESVPGFEPLVLQLGRLDVVLQAQVGARTPSDGEGDTIADGGGAGGAVRGIRSRQDAINALDAVGEFFRRNEPSSPIPMFLERAKRLVSKSFLEVLEDVAPDGLSQARSAGGVQKRD